MAIFLSACQFGEEEPLKIGFIGPLTGGAISYGKDMLHAVEMRVAEVNASGGINGRQIQLIAEDARCTSSDAASAAQKLINVDGVVAIVGGACSSETLGAAPISEAAGIVQISPISSSPDIKDAGDFIFRTIPSDAQKGIAIAEYAEKNGYTKVAMLSENTDYAVGLRDGIKNALSEDIELVFNETVEPGSKDFRALMTRLEDAEFDLFIANPQTDDVLGPMLTQFREQGFEQDIVSQDIADSMNLLEMAPEAAEGMRMFNTSNLLGTTSDGDAAPFATRFIEQHGNPQSNMSFSTLGYDASGVLFQAISEVGTGGEAVRDYLYALENFEGAAGGFHFDEFGEVVGIENVLKEFRDGEIVELTQ